MTDREYTAVEIEAAITQAISEGEVAVVPGLLRLLALKDARRAEQVLATIEFGLEMAKGGRS